MRYTNNDNLYLYVFGGDASAERLSYIGSYVNMYRKLRLYLLEFVGRQCGRLPLATAGLLLDHLSRQWQYQSVQYSGSTV